MLFVIFTVIIFFFFLFYSRFRALGISVNKAVKFELYTEKDFYSPFKIALAHIVCLSILLFTSTVSVFKKNRNDRLTC